MQDITFIFECNYLLHIKLYVGIALHFLHLKQDHLWALGEITNQDVNMAIAVFALRPKP